MKRDRYERAGVLVMVVWTVAVLSVFAIAIGGRVRQKMSLAVRLERRSALRALAHSGVDYVRAFLMSDPQRHQEFESASRKQRRFNNPTAFQRVDLADGWFEVSYAEYEVDLSHPETFYGCPDEERKLNLNVASVAEIKRLAMLTAGLNQEAAADLAHAIVDWREMGTGEVAGFYGDDYYRSLAFPYEPKKGSFERLEEVGLVKGMNPDVFARMRDFITIYGEGRVNINTAPIQVLMALGMSRHVAGIVAAGRMGRDGQPATGDDFVFRDPGEVSLSMEGFPDLAPEELAELDQLYVRRKITTRSSFFRVQVTAVHRISQEKRSIHCVVDGRDGTIIAWREFLY